MIALGAWMVDGNVRGPKRAEYNQNMRWRSASAITGGLFVMILGVALFIVHFVLGLA